MIKQDPNSGRIQQFVFESLDIESKEQILERRKELEQELADMLQETES